MAKLNPHSLRPLTRPEATETFTDPEQEGAEWALTLRGLDVVAGGLAEDHKQRLIADWVAIPDGEQEATVFPLSDGATVQMSETLCENVAYLYAMQSGAERYEVDELVAIAARMPNAWRDAMAFARGLNRRSSGAGNPPKPAGPATSEPSLPPSTTDSRIPGSSPG